MKALKIFFLSLFIIAAPVQQSQAVVSGVLAIAGSPAAGAVALSGLASAGVGLLATTNASSCDGGSCVVFLFLGLVAGAVLLEDGADNFAFSELSIDQAQELGLSAESIQIYNSEIDEVNLILEEVTSHLTAQSSVEESKTLWKEYKEFLSPQTFSVMQKLVTPTK